MFYLNINTTWNKEELLSHGSQDSAPSFGWDLNGLFCLNSHDRALGRDFSLAWIKANYQYVRAPINPSRLLKANSVLSTSQQGIYPTHQADHSSKVTSDEKDWKEARKREEQNRRARGKQDKSFLNQQALPGSAPRAQLTDTGRNKGNRLPKAVVLEVEVFLVSSIWPRCPSHVAPADPSSQTEYKWYSSRAVLQPSHTSHFTPAPHLPHSYPLGRFLGR